MTNVTTKRCENPDCGETFSPKRSDARFCGNRCRQAAHRQGKNPMVASAGVSGLRHRRTQAEALSRVLNRISGSLELSAGTLDYPKALSAPEAPLQEWEAQLTESIRFLSQVRRGVRDQMERDASDAVPAKDLRPGDWVRLGGHRVRITEVLTEPPEDGKGACYTRADNVWLRTGGKSPIAVLADEEVPLDRSPR